MRLGVPVKWTETRSENYPGHHPGPRPRRRGGDVGHCGREDHRPPHHGVPRVLGHTSRPQARASPTILHGLMYSGAYDIPNISGTILRGVQQPAHRSTAYRGAGRPEATTLIERLVDLLAAKLGMDPVELRRKNPDPQVRERTRRCYGPHLRQRGLRGNAGTSA